VREASLASQERELKTLRKAHSTWMNFKRKLNTSENDYTPAQCQRDTLVASKPVPKSWEEADGADRMLYVMRQQGRYDNEIDAMWELLTRNPPAPHSLDNRYKRIRFNMAKLEDNGDDEFLVRAAAAYPARTKSQTTREHDRAKFSQIRDEFIKAGRKKHATDLLRRELAAINSAKAGGYWLPLQQRRSLWAAAKSKPRKVRAYFDGWTEAMKEDYDWDYAEDEEVVARIKRVCVKLGRPIRVGDILDIEKGAADLVRAAAVESGAVDEGESFAVHTEVWQSESDDTEWGFCAENVHDDVDDDDDDDDDDDMLTDADAECDEEDLEFIPAMHAHHP
jgi:hypothetical protein